MKKNKVFILNIIFIVCIVIAIYILYISFIEKNVYKNSDFLSTQINKSEDYELAFNCVNKYIVKSSVNKRFIKFFLKYDDNEKSVKYNQKLQETYRDVSIIDIKKGINNVYIIYCKQNSEVQEINRIVIKVNKISNKFQVLSDRIYESI